MCIDDSTVLAFATLTGCVTSKHIVRKNNLSDNRQVNRILARLVKADCLFKCGSIRSNGPGKPLPIYAPSRIGFTRAGIKPREVQGIPSVTRSLLLAEFVSQCSGQYAIDLEEKDTIFESFGLRYPHRDKWYTGILTFATTERPHVVIPYTDYQAVVRICKDTTRRELAATYHLVVSTEIENKVKRLTQSILNPSGIYDTERSCEEWGQIGRKIVNADIELNGSKAFVLSQIKKILASAKEHPEKKYKLPNNIRIWPADIGLIFED